MLVVGVGTDAQDPVLRVQHHGDAARKVVRHECRHADAEIDVVAVAQLGGHAGGELVTRERHQSPSHRLAALRTVRRSMRLSGFGRDDDSLDEDARGVDVGRVDLARFDELFDLGDGDATGLAHNGLKFCAAFS